MAKSIRDELNVLERMTLLAGRPGTGKTSLALWRAAKEIVERRRPVLILTSIDGMDVKCASGLLERYIGQECGHRSMDYSAEMMSLCKFTRLPEESGSDALIDSIQNAAMAELIILDYIQGFVPHKSTLVEQGMEYDRFFSALRRCVVHTGKSLLMLSTVSRRVDQRQDQHPRLGDIQFFSSVEPYVNTFVLTAADWDGTPRPTIFAEIRRKPWLDRQMLFAEMDPKTQLIDI